MCSASRVDSLTSMRIDYLDIGKKKYFCNKFHNSRKFYQLPENTRSFHDFLQIHKISEQCVQDKKNLNNKIEIGNLGLVSEQCERGEQWQKYGK